MPSSTSPFEASCTSCVQCWSRRMDSTRRERLSDPSGRPVRGASTSPPRATGGGEHCCVRCPTSAPRQSSTSRATPIRSTREEPFLRRWCQSCRVPMSGTSCWNHGRSRTSGIVRSSTALLAPTQHRPSATPTARRQVNRCSGWRTPWHGPGVEEAGGERRSPISTSLLPLRRSKSLRNARPDCSPSGEESGQLPRATALGATQYRPASSKFQAATSFDP